MRIASELDSTNPVPVDLVASTGSVNTELPAAAALADNAANPTAPAVGAFGMLFDGTTWDRARGDSTNGALVNLGANNDMTVTGTVTANPGAPAAADVLAGRQSFTTTTGATTLITVPANRTWIGTIGASCSVGIDAASTTAGRATATFTTAGTDVTPAAGTYFVVDARSGANAATGLVGTQGNNFGSTPFVVNAPAGNSVTIAVASTNAGSASLVEAFASGRLI